MSTPETTFYRELYLKYLGRLFYGLFGFFFLIIVLTISYYYWEIYSPEPICTPVRGGECGFGSYLIYVLIFFATIPGALFSIVVAVGISFARHNQRSNLNIFKID